MKKNKIDEVYEKTKETKNIKIYNQDNGYIREKTSEKVYKTYEYRNERKVVETIHEDVRNTKLQMALYDVYGNRNAELLSAKREGYYIDERNGSSKLVSLEQLLLKIKKSKEEVKTYVCDGAKLKCIYFIGSYLILRVFDESAMLMGVDPIATETDKEIINFEFSSNVDAGEMNYICSKSMSKCDVLNAHWEGLADNVLSSGKKVVVNTSTLHCARSTEPITIVDNGQEFSDWEGMKNDLLRFHDENAYLFKFIAIKGILGIGKTVAIVGTGVASGGAIGGAIGVKIGTVASPGSGTVIGGVIGEVLGGVVGELVGIYLAAKSIEGDMKDIKEGIYGFQHRYESSVETSSKDKNLLESTNISQESAKDIIKSVNKKGIKNAHKGMGRRIGKSSLKNYLKNLIEPSKVFDKLRELEEKNLKSHIVRTIYPDKKWNDVTIDYFKENTYIIEKTEKRKVSPE